MGKINVYDKIMIENQKKKKIWKSKNFFYINLGLTNGLISNGIHNKLMPEGALYHLPYVTHIATIIRPATTLPTGQFSSALFVTLSLAPVSASPFLHFPVNGVSRLT